MTSSQAFHEISNPLAATEGSEGGAEAALVDSASRAVLVDGRGLALVDPAVADAFDALEAERCISIALECLQQVGWPSVGITFLYCS